VLDFLEFIKPELGRIASQTKGEVSVDDLYSEAYLLVLEFIDKHLREPTLEDRSWVIGRIHNRYITWTDYEFRNAIRLESYEDDEENSYVLELPAAAESNPLVEILFREEQLEHEKLLTNSYSEAKAYTVVFKNFDYDKESLSDYFFITKNTLDKRFDRAIIFLVNQPSLFDAIEVIDESFTPKPGLEKVKPKSTLLKDQLALTLE
jgi:DNA-directed RNA polymerase specialized sigma24 family protein